MQKPKDLIELTKEQKAAAAAKLREYAADTLEIELGNLQSELLVGFITNHIGAYYYNKAIDDAIAFMVQKADDLYFLMKDEKR